LFDAMRWLMIALLVSLGALLLAVAGVARHILRHRAQLHGKPPAGVDVALGPHEETTLESEH